MSEINDTKEVSEGISPISLKLIYQYQRKDSSLKDKYEMGTHQIVSFCGGSNINLNLITSEENIFITSILQSYVLHWNNIYLFHTLMDRTEATIFQHLYWPVIRKSVRKEVTNCDTCQCTKWPNEKYGKLPAKEDEYRPLNKLCAHLTGT